MTWFAPTEMNFRPTNATSTTRLAGPALSRGASGSYDDYHRHREALSKFGFVFAPPAAARLEPDAFAKTPYPLHSDIRLLRLVRGLSVPELHALADEQSEALLRLITVVCGAS